MKPGSACHLAGMVVAVLVVAAGGAWALVPPVQTDPAAPSVVAPTATSASVSHAESEVRVAWSGSLGYRYGFGVLHGRRGMRIPPYAGGSGFLDLDDDGKNDLLQDADGDGVPNVQDLDWVLTAPAPEAAPAEAPEPPAE